jgi:hypothetical protein
VPDASEATARATRLCPALGLLSAVQRAVSLVTGQVDVTGAGAAAAPAAVNGIVIYGFATGTISGVYYYPLVFIAFGAVQTISAMI